MQNKMNDQTIKKTIEILFNEVSPKYDTNLFFQITAQKMAKSFTSSKGYNILDVSTGTGIVSFEVLKEHKDVQVEAVDISQGMLNIASKKAEELNIKNITFKQADVENLTYKEKEFDILLCGFALFFYPNMLDTFNSLCNLIKTDGKFIFSSFTADAFVPYTDIFLETLQNDYNIEYSKEKQNLLSTKEDIEYLVHNKHNYKYTIEEVEISYSITPIQWWQLLNSAGYKALINQLNKKQLTEFKQKHLKDIEALSKDGKIVLNVNTLITTLFV